MSDDCCEAQPVTVEHTRLLDRREFRLSAASGVLFALGEAAELLDRSGAAWALLLAALVLGGATFVPEAIRRLVRPPRSLGVGTLMTVGAAGALALGRPGEAAGLAFLFSISEALEAHALRKAQDGLRALLSLVPPTALRLEDGTNLVVPIDDLRPGDTILIRAGDRLGVDVRITSGHAAVDLSAVTGESIPRELGTGDVVPAGALNGNAVLHGEVLTRAADSTLQRLVDIVQAAQGSKATEQRLADRIAGPLVPAVLVAAAVLGTVGSLLGDPFLWWQRAIVLVVAASPCSLAIAVPISVVAAVGAASRVGAVVKGGAALEALGGIRSIALDKTGTLTRNAPTVIDVATTTGHKSQDVVRFAAALESATDHPLAAAIVRAAVTDEIAIPPATDVRTEIGHGITGTVRGLKVRVGKATWLEPGEHTPWIDRQAAGGATPVLVEVDGLTIGGLAVRDEPRAEAGCVLSDLTALGIANITMVTGDSAPNARAVAALVGITDVEADLLPEDKVAVIRRLRESGPVAMVGDGINDAPALATATVGIAMGALGNDAAIEAADAALLGSDLHVLPAMLTIATRARRIMRQNLAASLAVLAVVVPLGAFGGLSLGQTVAVHEIAEFVVILNGLRAGRAAGDGCRRSTGSPGRPAVAG